MLEWALFRLLTVAIFILATAFFVAAEFALVSIRETRIEQLVALGRPGARTALRLKREIDEFLAADQFGVTLSSLALGWVGEAALAEMVEKTLLSIYWVRTVPAIHEHISAYSHGFSILVAFSLITYLEVLLGEQVPKSLALQRAERIALAVAGPMDVFIRITRPAVRAMKASTALVLRVFRVPLRGEGDVHSPEELKLIATQTRRMGLLPELQERMIHRAIELNLVSAREIMTPRGRIFSLPADMAVEQASARIIEEQHSRVPVYDSKMGPEHIIGVVYSKDISRLMHFRSMGLSRGGDEDEEASLRLQQVMHDVLVVPETKSAVDLLQEFRERRRQVAIVVDEFGSTVGLVTAEDVLEQLVGELEDEFDVVARTFVVGPDGLLELDGTVNLRDLTTQLHWQFPREPGVETLAGFVLAQLGHIPHVGESFNYEGRLYTVLMMSGRRISRIRVEQRRLSKTPQVMEDEEETTPAGSD